MGMIVVVACGVAAVFHIIVLPLALLCVSAGEESLALLGDHVGDIAALALEIVAHGAGIVGGAPLLEYGGADHRAGRVFGAHGVDLRFVHVEFDVGGGEFQVAVVDVAVAIHICGVAAYHHHRVFRREHHLIVEIDFGAADARAADGVGDIVERGVAPYGAFAAGAQFRHRVGEVFMHSPERVCDALMHFPERVDDIDNAVSAVGNGVIINCF